MQPAANMRTWPFDWGGETDHFVQRSAFLAVAMHWVKYTRDFSTPSLLRAKDPKVQCAQVCITAVGLVLQGITGSEHWPLDALI